MTDIIIPSILTSLTLLIPAYLLHKREMRKIKNEVSFKELQLNKSKELSLLNMKKADYLPRIMTLRNSSSITHAVQEIFNLTKATRFLIFIGVNGKFDLNSVSCVWYLYKNEKDNVDAIKKYASVDITEDSFYKGLLKKVSKYTHKYEEIETLKMPESLLKHIYYEEEVTHTKIGFLNREEIDKENDFLAFFSVSTDEDEGYTPMEKSIIKRIVDSQIKTNLISILD
jgi:hypothetical protein